MAYMGGSASVYDLLFNFKHSLVIQSLHSTEGAEATNGDGFGMGWYADDYDDPLLFRSVEPAWHDRNLKEIAQAISAHTIFAHVRAASPSVANVQQTNCHPFRHDGWLWMHNGVIRGFKQIKRDLMLKIDADLYPCIEGSTDSETFFYLALTFGLKEDPPTAVAKAVGFITTLAKAKGVEFPVQMTVATTDGTGRLWAFRYSTERKSRTLYYSTDIDSIIELYQDDAAAQKRKSIIRYKNYTGDTRFVVSEPLGDVKGVWNLVDEATCVYVEKGDLTMTPFEPIYE